MLLYFIKFVNISLLLVISRLLSSCTWEETARLGPQRTALEFGVSSGLKAQLQEQAEKHSTELQERRKRELSPFWAGIGGFSQAAIAEWQ